MVLAKWCRISRKDVKLTIFALILVIGLGNIYAQHRIMPLGNSITRGMGGDEPYTGYRDDLYHLLIDDGWNVDFVGSMQDGDPGNFDVDHEGHGGWKANDIDDNINTWLEDSAPDVILLHIGTNDVGAGELNSHTIDEIESILNKIFSYNPDIRVLLCKLIPRKETPDNEHIRLEELNDLIVQLYNEKKQAGFPIYLVDQNAAFKENDNWADDYMIDNVHPNDAGYAVMANTFFTVLQTVTFPDLVLTVLTNPENAGYVIVDPDKEKYNYYERVTLTAVANANYRFDHWSGDIDLNSTNPREIIMLRARTIVANFVDDGEEYVTTPDRPTGPSSGNTGEELSFSTGGAYSNLGHEIEYQFDWGDGNKSGWGGANRNHTFSSAGIYEIRARARCTIHTDVVSSWSNSLVVTISGEVKYVLTVVINPEGAGTVNIDPDKSEYEPNEIVHLEAIPANENFHFNFWSGDIDTNYNSSINIYMVKSRTLVANFSSDLNTYNLSVSVDPANAGYITKNPDKLSYNEGETVELTAHSYNGRQNVDNIYIEAESGVLSGDMASGDDPDASGGQYIYNTTSTPKSGRAEYTFEVEEAGTYALWGRCYALSGTEDSFFIVVDGSSDTLTWHLATPYNTWLWQKVSDWYSIQEFDLTQGTHSVTVVSRDINARLDKLIFSKEPNFVPSGKEENPAGRTYVFDYWSGDATGGQNPVTIVMNSDKNVTAHFFETQEIVSIPNMPSGPSSGEVGQNLTFITGGASSSLGNPVEYQFDFGDGTQSDWGGTTRSHSYSVAGNYTVRARARSQVMPEVVSDWSEGLSVSISEFQPITLTVNVVPEGAGTVDRNPYKSFYNENEWVELTAVPKVMDDNIRIEAESGTLYGPVAVGVDNEASGNQYVFGTSSVPKAARVEYNFQIEQAGTYYIWGRCYALSSTEDSFFMVVDGSSDTLTWHLDTEYYVWKWQKVSDQHIVQTFNLLPGWHTITLITRDINARLDNFLITEDPSYIPAGKEEFYSDIKLEAEDGSLNGPIEIGYDPQASNNQYIYGTSAVPMSASAEYTFDIGTAGTYYIWGRCYALSGTEDSFFIQVDEDPNILTWHLSTEYHVWKWQRVSHDHVEQTFPFSKGQHTLRVITRDINSRIDKILITNNPSYIPSGKEDTPSSRDITYRFDRWEGDVSGNSNPTGILMNESKTVTAYFVEADEYVSPPTTIQGPANGIMGQNLSFIASGASSSMGNDVEYQFDWGDGSLSLWGSNIQDYVYNTSGVMIVKARARSVVDTNNVSSWSESSLAVTITGLTLAISIDPANTGTVSKTPNKALYAYGDTVMLVPSSMEGYVFDHWNGDLIGNANPANLVMNTNKSVTAVFVQSSETVSRPTSVNGPENGILGQSLTFTTTGSISNLGHEVEYQFDWGDGTMSEWGINTRNHSYNVTGIMQVKARARCKIHTNVISDWSDPHSITITGFAITVTIDPQGKGLVTKNPNKNKYGYGEKVALTALALDGYEFDHWSGDLAGTNNPDTLIMTGNKQVTAFFSQTQESVSPPTFVTGQDSAFVEQSVTFTTGGAVSNLGNPVEYQFDWGDGTLSDWGDSCRSHIYHSIGTMQIRSRARSQTNISIISDWSESHRLVLLNIYYTISISIDPEGSGSVNRTPFKSEYRDGEIVILTPIPVTGYIFDHWTGDLMGIDNPAFVSMDDNKQITAHFKMISEVENQRNRIPETFELTQNYPNPFNPETTIEYQLAKDCHVKITVYNIQGQVITTLIDEFKPAGFYSIRWNATDIFGNMMPSGVYLYKIETEYFKQLKKMILMK